MKHLGIIVFILSLSVFSLAQDNPSDLDKKSETTIADTESIDEEREAFKNAIAQKDAAKRVAALKNFVEKYPESEQKDRALGLIVSGRAELADINLREGKNEEGIKLFKLAVTEAPNPISDRLFRAIILQIPNNLFFRGERIAGVEVAKLIETKVADNPKQLLALTNFYLGIENAPAAIRVAEKVKEINPETKGLYQALGLAYRFNFDLEKSAESYAKGLEADPESIAAKISLAEMTRAIGNADEAMKLYREVLEVEPKNLSAMTGLTLSLFDIGNKADAEYQMKLTLIQEPNNLFLLVGAAYWYAANGNGEKAIELSQKALTVEPRYTWGYIALARGYMKKGDPVAAERALITARKFGSFPTLQFELALSRLAAGFYKDAADELQKSFRLKDGILKTKLGGRIEVEAEDFGKLLSLERQASIFQSKSSYDEENTKQLKKLLDFTQKLTTEGIDDDSVVNSANGFIDGDDKMKTHRQIYVADQLLSDERALSTVIEITKEAVKGVEDALNVVSPSSAVLANDLYETRQLAFKKGEILNTPQIPQQTLESIIRGRIEQISALALQKQEKNEEAEIRIKRAISIFPKDSIWMRQSNWRMGLILQAQDKPKEALDYFIKGYVGEDPSFAKKVVLETAYKKVHGTLDGLDERLKAKPEQTDAASIFVKKADTDESKIEPKEDSFNGENVNEVAPDKTKENSDTSSTTSEDVIPADESKKPNVSKLPEDVDLNIFSPTKTSSEEDKKELQNTNENSADDSKKGTSKNIRPPQVIVEDGLSNTKTKIEINKDPEIKKSDVDTSDESREEVVKNEGDIESKKVSRERIVGIPEIAPPTCEILTTHEELTILNNGDGHDVVIVVDKSTVDAEFTADSSSPDDIEVAVLPKVNEENRSAFFIVRSISSKTGEFYVVFTTPCGKKLIKVKVR